MRNYPASQCLLFRTGSKNRLAKALQITPGQLENLEANPKFRIVVNGGKTYFPPHGTLRHVHDRVLALLKKVETRSYHKSDKKGCSNVLNAGSHILDYGVMKTDIKNYFPSVKKSDVVEFFHKKMQTSRPVANALDQLLCKDDFLVKGSPVSGFLAFWSNVDMFDKIYNLCSDADAEFTLYADDITISSKRHKPDLLRRVNGIIRQYGYTPHKCAIYKPNSEKVITGVVLGKLNYRAKKSTFRKIRKDSPRVVRRGASHYVTYVDTLNEPAYEVEQF